MRINVIKCLLAVSIFLHMSCAPEVLPSVLKANQEGRVSIKLSVQEGASSTRASLLGGSDDKNSGALVAIYYSSTGLMDSVQEIPSEAIGTKGNPASEYALISVPASQELEIFVLGNLWAISKDGGSKTNIATAYAERFPSNMSDLKAWSYHLDGRDINDEYRHQVLDEVAEYGIPFSGSVKVSTGEEGASLTMNCKRLFSKLKLTVDHGGLDGGKSADYFRNVSLHLRQANGNLQPFSDLPFKATEPSDMIDGDYDAAMENASRLSFELYVPENMQGTLLPGNINPDEKNYDNIISMFGSEKASLLTYVEFTGEVNPEAGGYGGKVCYRFYLGNDNCSNFDLERNRCYDVELGFRLNSLFSPSWKVSPEITDSRQIGICADEARTRMLPEEQMVAVRKNRAGIVYPYVVAGHSSVPRKPDGLGGEGKFPSDLSECYLSADFLVDAESPSKQALDNLGISASYDESSGCVRFEVTDPSSFVAGKELRLCLNTLPEGNTSFFRIATFDDINVEWNDSLTEKFVPGMSRTADISGFSSPVSYRSTTVHCYKYIPVPGDDGIIGSSYLSNPVLTDDSFTFYNFLCCSASSCMESVIYLRPADDFNDGNNDGLLDDDDAVACTVINHWPSVEFKGVKHPTRIELDIAGHEEQIFLELGVQTSEGVASLEYSDFDETIFDMVYMPHIGLRSGESELRDEEGNVLFKGNPDSYIGLKRTYHKTTSGWPVYEIYRNRIGDRYSTREKVSYNNYFIAYMPSLFLDGIYHGKNSDYLEISFLPFLAEDFDAEFSEVYHDYTFWNPEYLDHAYRKLAENSVSASSGKSVDFGLKDISSLELYARPVASTESAYLSDGASGSISITQQIPSGPLTMSFVETGTEMHTAGPHRVYASFTNIHSGESREELLGEFLVYVHFAVGLDLEIDHMNGYKNLGSFNVYPVLMNDVSRCSYSDVEDQLYPMLWVKNGSSFEYYTGNEPSGSFHGTLSFPSDPSVIGNRHAAVKVLPASYGREDPVITFSPVCHYDNTSADHVWTDAYYFMDLCKEFPHIFCELITTNSDYVFRFDNGYENGTDVYDDTAFSDLRGPDGKGFYRFHLLNELRSDSKGWIPLFEHCAGL